MNSDLDLPFVTSSISKPGARVFWLLPKWPVPADDGAKVANLSLLQHLKLDDVELHVIALSFVGEKIDPGQAQGLPNFKRSTIISCKRKGLRKIFATLISLLTRPSLAFTLHNYVSSELKNLLSAELGRGTKNDLIIYDGLHIAAHSNYRGKYVLPSDQVKIVYRAHNREADLWYRKAAQSQNWLKRLLFKWQANRVKAFEDSLAVHSKAIACVSEEDLRTFSGKTSAKLEVVPIGYEFGGVPDYPSTDPTQIMFIGKLDWYPNHEGLLWFLGKVWPKVRQERKDLELVIVGSGAGETIKGAAQIEGVKFLGRVDCVDQVYAESALSIIPVFYGSGTRVKAIEAARFGRPVLSTALGVEGLGLVAGQSYIRAESESEWIKSLLQLERTTLESVGAAARRELEKRFEAADCAAKFRELMDLVLGAA